MWVCCCALFVVTGCDVFFPSTEPPTHAAANDAPVPVCFGRDFVRICLDEPPTQILELPNPGVVIDTDNGPCVPYTNLPPTPDPDACVIATASIRIGGGLRAVGSRSLVLIALTTIEITGSVDVSSARDTVGAGALGINDGVDCQLIAATGQGGGAGGSMGGSGRDGGSGDQGNPGVSRLLLPPGRLRGGCPGGNGADGVGINSNFGNAGGAIAMIAETITIIDGGQITASGAGGGGGAAGGGSTVAGGGGGGGSGGMILLQGTLVTDSRAQVYANGGGGGEGGTIGNEGCPGGESLGAASPAKGGGDPTESGCASNLSGGVGGAGSALEMPPTIGNSVVGGSASGGGGGGGAAGITRVVPPQAVPGMFSPAPS